MELADEGRLSRPRVIRRQVERMLEDPRGGDFIPDFAAQWLDLSEIDFTEPDRRLYPGFDLIVQNAMLDETHAFLQTMLAEDLSGSHLIDSDFTYLNSRLARFYEIDRVRGDSLQRVALRPRDRRGGVLTQGAILKVTANGTTTSPVIRGVWVGERLLEHTAVLLTSNLGNASSHDNRNMPVLLAGGGFRHGQHLAFDRKNNYPLPNLFVSVMQRVGLERDQFASSTGTLRGLEPT